MSRRSGIKHYDYWLGMPPEPSPKMAKHVRKIREGWRPNRRIWGNGRDECGGFYDIYQAEWYALVWFMGEGYWGGPPEHEIVAWMDRYFGASRPVQEEGR